MNLNTLLLQVTQTADTAQKVAEMNLFDMALKGGWIMIPLLLLGMLAIYIFIERLIVVKKASKKDATFMNKIKDYINEGKIEAALALCKKTDTPYSRMIEKGISRLGRPMNDVLVAVENVGNLEIMKLEKGLPLLATVAGGAPMVGFLGTVVGMVQAFFNMENAGNNVDVTALAGGIYTAMVTTVAGLIVGIIAYFAYNYLTGRIGNVISNMEARSLEFMDILNEPAE
ncbi:MAG: MotA/TolQ/ExbB proton channel family protein [Prevotellaceae bacterium]|jgi:biopolymer transport protein ExbB|nr:MotA/TolQ/ExbB proton channel family protein [Prevotellaceae bacterium]